MHRVASEVTVSIYANEGKYAKSASARKRNLETIKNKGTSSA